MESWQIMFGAFIIMGFVAAIVAGQLEFLIIPFIMSIILVIAALRGKPKSRPRPVSTYSNPNLNPNPNSISSSSTYSADSKESAYDGSSTHDDPIRKYNSPWQPKKGGPFEK
jgi:hypothetical protein